MTKDNGKAATKKPKAAETDELDEMFPNMFGLNGNAMNLMRGGSLAMERWVATSQELSRFYTKRLKKDVELANAFASCRTPEDFAEVWSSAASTMVHDYADEFDRMMAINLKQ
jgi:hypothetical protein